MEDEDKKVKEKGNPQILEMQQTIDQLSTNLAKATEVMAERDKEILEMRTASTKIADDKLTKEKDLKEQFGIKNPSASIKKTPDDINSLNNVDMLDIIAEAVETTIDAVKTESESAMAINFKGLESKFDQITNHLMKTEASQELSRVRTANPDFDNYKDDIRKILESHQSFSIEDAYDWIKMKEAKGEIASKHIDSEKPNKDLSAADEAVVRSKKETAVRKPSNQRQFRTKLDEAIERVQARRGGN